MDKKHDSISDLDGSLFEEKILSRRDFLKTLVIGGGTMVLVGCGVTSSVPDTTSGTDGKRVFSYIAVDHTKCTGCRTCEAVCAAFNNPLYEKGNFKSSLGNPIFSNIQVHNFNPDVSAPAVCSRCQDTPCVKVCPADPDPKTGHRAMYQDDKLGVIKNNTSTCILCGKCIQACKEQSVGILSKNPESGYPMGMCTLCDGNPQCVEHCPYEALSILQVNGDHEFYRMSPEEVSNELNKRWYNLT